MQYTHIDDSYRPKAHIMQYYISDVLVTPKEYPRKLWTPKCL